MATLAAVGQLCSTASPKANLEQCVRLVAGAAAGGAKMLFLPEASDYVAPDGQTALALAEPQATSSFVLGLRAAARQHKVAIHVGIHDVGKEDERLRNRALYITESGQVDESASYDKVHVFDYGTLRESATVQPGLSLTAPFSTPVGRIGSLICFDVRFPEASQALSRWRASPPAQVLTYPSAFTVRTGAAHWEVLLRARAIECQSWVVAAAQVGRHNERRASFGRSIVVDPWGSVKLRLAGVVDDAGEAEEGAVGELGFVEIDAAEADRVRAEMPLRRRTDVFPELT
ncbi:hypothetical protein XA68_17526 [Ophiocordyceps unilateralis]|uniref:CN hydrolase domain-containing protein n=1 Tax=Ophiocordyceps unilateralis TaxID=268505 RepID=A0A2A9P4Q4_OPHUN|nr:hypothetical protein XA68_17526 [Ophiocordyceps unilateralis]